MIKIQYKCVSKTDTNPPFAFQIAFPRGTDFTEFLQGGSKSRDLQSEISVRIEIQGRRKGPKTSSAHSPPLPPHLPSPPPPLPPLPLEVGPLPFP